MVMPNFHLASNGASLAGFETERYAPNASAISVSDYCSVSQTSERIRFTRPTVDGQGFEYSNPGARVRFQSNTSFLRLWFLYNNLVTRPDTYNGIGLVLVDGAQYATFDRAQGAAGEISVAVNFGSTTSRTIEVVMPFCAGVDFTGVDVVVGSTMTSAPARTATRYVALGDSITHGFSVSSVAQSWAYKLAIAKNWQIINNGYGGRPAVATDGTKLKDLTPDVATYLIGYNNFYPQYSLTDFKTEFKGVLTNFRASGATAKLYCITPTWTPNTFGALTIEQYRQQIRDGISEIGNALNVLVEGPALATNALSSFPDGVHPNDAGATEMATALGSLVSV